MIKRFSYTYIFEELTTNNTDDAFKENLFKTKSKMVRNIDSKIAKCGNFAPHIIPTLIDQNRNIKSIGSFIAVLKRTIDNAPTIPKDIIKLDCIDKITADVIIATPIKEILKFFE